MLVFGHIGLTLGLARALHRQIDARWVAVASMLPDLIDKPLQYVIAPAFTHGNTRTVGHSLTVMLVCMVLVAFPLRRTIRAARVVALLLPCHWLFDSMWKPAERVSLLWPWAGNHFAPAHDSGVQAFGANLLSDLYDPVNLLGELGGLLVLGFFWYWCGLRDATRRARLWRTGALLPFRRDHGHGAPSVRGASPAARGLST